MTDTNIQLFTNLGMNLVDNATAKGNKAEFQLPEFGKVLSNLKQKQAVQPNLTKSESTENVAVDVKQNSTKQEKVETVGGESINKIQDKIKEVNEVTTEPAPEEAQAVVEQVSAMIIQIVTQELNITQEELTNALQELDMTVVDMMEPSNLAMVFDFFGEQGQLIDVLMNENFKEASSQIMNIATEIATELGMDVDNVKQMLFQLEEIAMDVEVEETTVISDSDEEILPQTQKAETVVNEAVEKNDVPTILVRDEEVTTDTVKAEELSAVAEESIVTPKETEEKEGGFDSQKDETFANPKADKTEEPHHLNAATHVETQTVTTADGSIVVEQEVKVVDLQRLVSELTEYISLKSSGNQISSMEMQLNPMNLGKVLVEVMTRQGEVSAKIMTQTEAAKEAMEANVTQLKENLEQQGVKISAVEVTVESHGFEQNLQEDGSKEQQQLAKEMQQQNRRMNLNLNEMTLDDLQGLMSEEDLLVAKIMRDQGNVLNIEA